MDKEIIIHVGTHKAASTYLQQSVFPYLKDVYFFRLNNEKGTPNPLYILNDLIMQSVFEKKSESICLDNIDEIKNQIYSFINSIKESKILISSEALWQKSSLTKILKELFPNAKILLIIREQISWLESYYNYYIKLGDHAELEEEILRNKAFNFNLLEIYQHYVDNFGKENILVLPYEQIKEDERKFLDTLWAGQSLVLIIEFEKL